MQHKYGIYLIAGFSVKRQNEDKSRNIAAVYDRNGRRIAAYTKIHPFSFADEDKYYIAGSNPIIFSINNIPCSVFICYDLRFPEVFRKVAKNVQAIFVIANWPASRKDHWETLLKARAIENQCFVIGVNRTATDRNGIHYSEASHIFNPSSNDILCGDDKEEFLTGEINPSEVTEVRLRFQFLNDMSI